MKKIFTAILCVCTSGVLCAQDSTVHQLREARITTDRSIHDPEPLQDSLYALMNPLSSVGQMLLLSGKANVLAYGPEGSAITSRRGGTGAVHASVNWNGLPLESPSLGLTDLSMIPLFLVGNGGVHFHDQGALNSGGALGGVIDIQNEKDPRGGLTLMSRYNTLLNPAAGLKFSHVDSSWLSTSGVVFNQMKNRFDYHDHYRDDQLVSQSNNGDQWAAMQRFQGKLGQNQMWELSAWTLVRKVELPPLMGDLFTPRTELQDDSLWRVSGQWKWVGRQSVLRLRGAYLSDDQRYRSFISSSEETGAIDSQIGTRRWIGDADWSIEGKGWATVLGGRHSFTEVVNSNYNNGLAQQQLSAVFGRVAGEWMGIGINANGRLEKLWTSDLPVVPAFELKAQKALDKGKWELLPTLLISRKSRLPSFNDLYWIPGGNADLNPERGWQYSASLEAVRQFQDTRLTGKTEFTTASIQDWIQWIPVNGVFTAENFKKVEYREWRSSASVNVLRKGRLGAGYILTDARYTNDQEKEGSMPYIPRHQFQGSATLVHRQWIIWSTARWMSRRWTDEINTPHLGLDPMGSVELGLAKTINKNSFSATFLLVVFNLLDNDLEYVKYRASPGRNMQISLQLEIF